METIKLIANNLKIPVKTWKAGKRIYFKFGFNRALLNEIKSFDGAKWHPETKEWSILDNQRNNFQLEFLQGKNPYAWFDQPLKKFVYERPLKEHQKLLADSWLTYHYNIGAAEMGTGKSLCAIETIEKSGFTNWWYVGPKGAISYSIPLEFRKWNAKILPKFFTYEGLVKIVENWRTGDPAPQGIVFDEAQRAKTPTAKRSQAALHIANSIREEYGKEGYVIEMSGSPATRDPTDWWHQCITKDTWIQTSEGPKQVSQLIDKPFLANVNGTLHKSEGFFKTGNKQVYQLVTKEGYSLKATENHKILRSCFGLQSWCELGNLKQGDEVVLNQNVNQNWGTNLNSSFGDGYILGLVYGDGSLAERNKNSKKYYGTITFNRCDFETIPFIKTCFPFEIKLNYYQPSDYFRIYNSYINQLIWDHGVKPEKVITKEIEQESSEFIKGFLSGFFDCDGSVNKHKLRIQLTQANIERLWAVQRLLQYFGIRSSIFLTNKAKVLLFKNKVTNVKDVFDLYIIGYDAIKFEQEIGFQTPYKAQRLREKIKRKHDCIYKETATVEKVIPLGKEDVYDCVVNDVHCFSANGIIVHNCEIVCPGYLKEGTIQKFKNRLAIIKPTENPITGGTFPRLVAWRDNEKRCDICGQFEAEHELSCLDDSDFHVFKPSKNEVAYLYERMKGLVVVIFKKDVLSLPEKEYIEQKLEPSKETVRLAKLIASKSSRAIEALTLLRELSDGFQYSKEKTGNKITCERCSGTGKVKEFEPNFAEKADEINYSELSDQICDNCGGSGKTDEIKVISKVLKTPKEDQLIEDLESCEDSGRIVIFAGFTASIDRIVKICQKLDWLVIRVDGRGWYHPNITENPLVAFQELKEKYPKIAYVAHPESGGVSVTLTASSLSVFWSNDFKAENRIQAEDRSHRMGMDLNKGLIIKDYIHLGTDKYVLDNLKKKKDLQAMSLGDMSKVIEALET